MRFKADPYCKISYCQLNCFYDDLDTDSAIDFLISGNSKSVPQQRCVIFNQTNINSIDYCYKNMETKFVNSFDTYYL